MVFLEIAKRQPTPNLNFASLKKDMKSTIQIEVQLDENRVPEQIEWTSTEGTDGQMLKTKAVMLNFWDHSDKTALRLDLWTKEMMVDEMADFMYQTIFSMADTFQRATANEALATELKEHARNFYKKFRASQVKENQ
jgi:gliding motility-associated protein GldC